MYVWLGWGGNGGWTFFFLTRRFRRSCWSRLNINWPDIHNRIDAVFQSKASFQGPLFFEILLLLCRDLEIEETFNLKRVIWDVVRSQELDKVPGPDDFSARFYVACWSIIKLDMMVVFQSLWEGTVGGSMWQIRLWCPCFPSGGCGGSEGFSSD
jgi:hypothetical protein